MRHALALGVFIVSAGVLSAQPAAAFSLSFDWGNIPKCTTGRPGRVPNPVFKLGKVPKGTATIRFDLKDLQVPRYPHGGGKVAYTGKSTIAPGAFKYNSPCPPGGRHTYEWTAVAQDKAGKVLATAKAKRKYP
ncbi:phospholipid-binding protein [Breoghania sp. L-A4]|uniref:phospholipid-binding protein n=1 Tax=Breoghania sp. L-A4 TaxID=2304600 RepID=UPI000E35AB8C|nr:phospholipid-binding protein [Breoghania sp. L-A4]AXS41456.1 phospholipid-binding protein [Breoghania sp. L-A4]